MVSYNIIGCVCVCVCVCADFGLSGFKAAGGLVVTIIKQHPGDSRSCDNVDLHQMLVEDSARTQKKKKKTVCTVDMWDASKRILRIQIKII